MPLFYRTTAPFVTPVKEILLTINMSAKPTRARTATDWLEMREAVEQVLEQLQVRAVVIDEAQHLMQVETGHKAVEQLDWLKSMTNRTKAVHILVGPYELCDFRNLSGQAARRGHDVHFPRYRLDVLAERMEFAGALRYLVERVPLICDLSDFLNRWRWFGEMSLGCIGILKDWLVQTCATALADGETTLTLAALETHALTSGQRVRLELDARAGEHKLAAESAASQHQLETLLGVPPPVAPADGALVPPKAKRGRKPGTRAPIRDPAGEGTALGE